MVGKRIVLLRGILSSQVFKTTFDIVFKTVIKVRVLYNLATEGGFVNWREALEHPNSCSIYETKSVPLKGPVNHNEIPLPPKVHFWICILCGGIYLQRPIS
ncbi:unnamed protein product [Sphenostylis stenocarpa]|uniref:Uncharacterized protein n=1 Tax=Sphenostylis stenocarpa TaxID=92480 RepID=A0AA86VV28_9FABA|nr:unnamed protein product [Sphenostylis stenocarpa]